MTDEQYKGLRKILLQILWETLDPESSCAYWDLAMERAGETKEEKQARFNGTKV